MRDAIRAFALWALVALPALATAQPTDTSSVQVGPAGSGARAFVARPTGKGPWPGVVVGHDAWGLDEPMRNVARRLAQEGYVAIAPGFDHGQTEGESEGGPVRRQVDELAAAVRWLGASSYVGPRRIGVIGFGTGGGAALGLALRDSTLAVTVVYYPSPLPDLDALGRSRRPLQVHLAEQDASITADQVAALREGLRRAGREGDVYLYAGAGHGFMDDARPTYHRDAARQAWARTLALLQKLLKG